MFKFRLAKHRGMDGISDRAFTSGRKSNLLDVVIVVQTTDPAGCRGITAWHKEWFQADFCLGVGVWTLYGVLFESLESGVGFLSRGPDMHAFCKPCRTPSAFKMLRETCFGLGGIPQVPAIWTFAPVSVMTKAPLPAKPSSRTADALSRRHADRNVAKAMHIAPDVSGLFI